MKLVLSVSAVTVNTGQPNAGGRAGQRNVSIVRDQIALCPDHVFGERLFVVGTPAQAQARRLERERPGNAGRRSRQVSGLVRR